MERKSQQAEEVLLRRLVQSANKYSAKTVNWTRRNFFVALFVGVLGVGTPLVIHFYGSMGQETQEKEVSTQKNAASESDKPKLTTISISSIHVSEVAMDIPAAFELGIEVGGFTNLAAYDIDIILDFGRAEIQACDYTPGSVVSSVSEEDKSHRRIQIEVLDQGEKFYIRCLLSSPVFNQVIITGGNIDSRVTMNFKQYQEGWLRLRSESTGVGFWRIIFRIAAVYFIIIFSLKIAGRLFDL